jgi:PadR family transcriptional regulator, regulatory protein PadR
MGETNKPGGDLLRGTLDVLILQALTRGTEHGYGVARWIEAHSGDVLRIEEGSLYPALRRLEARGLIDSSWGTSSNNRRARYYTLTREGRARVREETEAWSTFAHAVTRVLRAARG